MQGLAMQEMHSPADPEQRDHKTNEAVCAITQPITIGALCNQTKDDARQQGEYQGHFEVRKVDGHKLILLSGGDLVRVHQGKNI